MPRYSLFGNQVRQFVGGEENVATEVLNNILGRSTVARHALIQFIARSSGLALPEDLAFSTQSLGEKNAILDLVGVNHQGQKRLVIEAKFWAQLTPNQPVTYICSLPTDGPCVLVFLAPTPRLDALWSELLAPCRDAALIEAGVATTGSNPRSIPLNYQRVLTLVSWRQLLTEMASALEAAGETDHSAEVNELLGLCEQMDGSSFLSLQSEEAGARLSEAMSQYGPLIEPIVRHMAAQGIGTLKGKRAGRGEGWQGCYVNVDPYLFLVSVDARHWANYADTPFWLSVYTQDGKGLPLTLRRTLPQSCLFVKDHFGADHCLVPLFAPEEGEQDDVARELAAQVAQVAGYLRQR